MQALSTTEFATRLAVGLACGALIGIERQWRARMAGLRTNALVATGATVFVLYSVAVGGAGSTRVASYVVSGIGFLGGGVILRDGFNVRGLNTAATLWCSAAVGVMAASGRLAFATLTTATVLTVHLLGRPLGRLIDRAPKSEEDLRPYRLHLTCQTEAETHIRALLVQHTTGGDIILGGLDATRPDPAADAVRLSARLLCNGDASALLEHLVARLSLEPGLQAIHWHATDDDLDADPLPHVRTSIAGA